MRLTSERFLELSRLYRSFSERLNGSLLLLSEDWADNYPDARDLRVKVYSALKDAELSGDINRAYIVFGCMQDSVYFSAKNYKIVVLNEEISLKSMELSTKMGKGNILIGLEITKNTYVDLPKAIYGISSAVKYNIEDAYELLSILNIFAVATKYGLSAELEGVLGEVLLFLGKLDKCNVKQENIDDLYRKLLMARAALKDYSYTIGSFGVLRTGIVARNIWMRRFGDLPKSLEPVFVLSDPLFRSRSGIFGTVVVFDPKQKPDIKCLGLIAFSLETPSKDQLSRLEKFAKNVIFILYNYVSRFLIFGDRIMLSIPQSGTLTLYMARR